MESLVLILFLSATFSGTNADPSRIDDDELRGEIEEAASDSRLLADELEAMLARLEVDDSRQDAVEAAVIGDDLGVETALEEMLDKLSNLETVAKEDLKVPELKGTLDEKIEKEEELKKTLETLEAVAKQIEDVSSDKDIKTIEDISELLENINDKIENSVSGDEGKSKFGLKSSLHLNGIVGMIQSLEKVTDDLKSMQDGIDDYFDDDTKTKSKGIKDERKPKTLSEVINPKAKSQLKEKKLKQKERKGKQYDYDDYEEFGDDDGDYEDDAEVVDVVDAKDGSSGAQEEGDDTEDCETKEAKSKVRVCVPKFSSVEQTVNLYTSHPSDVRHCYDVSKTVCSESSQIVSNEVCIYGYTQNVVVAPIQLAEITFEKRLKPFSVSKCSKTTVKDGYKDKEVEECVHETVETPYRLPSIVDNLDDFFELNIPEPEMKCQLYRYDIPEVMCKDITRRECSDMTFLEPVTSTEYIQTSQPSYDQANCTPRVLALSQKKCAPPKLEKKENYSY